MNRKLPLRFVTSNMTGHALWQTFANHAEADEPDTGSMPEPVSHVLWNGCIFSVEFKTILIIFIV